LLLVSKANYEVLTEAGAEGAPDLVVEILSPKTAHLDKKAKRRVYARSGVTELWIIDPELRLIHVYALRQDPERPAFTISERESFTSTLLPGLRIRAARVFRS
jgi:Uma2 family endonuclease